MEKIKIYYWCPFIYKVATVRSVINSAISLKKFNQEKYDVVIINALGEWNDYESYFNKKNIKLKNLNKSNLLYNIKSQGFFIRK